MLWGPALELPAWTCGPLKAAVLSVARPPAGAGLEHTYTLGEVCGVREEQCTGNSATRLL